MGEVLHASYSGYFPFCIRNGIPAGSENYYQFSTTLRDLMKIFWVVKEYEISVPGLAYTETVKMGEFFTNVSLVPDAEPPVIWYMPPFAREEDYVCFSERQFEFVSGDPQYAPGMGNLQVLPYLSYIRKSFGTNRLVEVSFITGAPGLTTPEGIARVDENFYPLFYSEIIKTPFPAQNNFWLRTLPTLFGPSSFYVDFFGLAQIPLNYVLDPAFSGFNGSNIILTAKSYWSYGGTWDETTGELLN